MKVKVRWQVTEEHEAVIEVDDDDFETDPEGVDLDDSILAEHEDSNSYQSTPERAVLEYAPVEEES